MNKHRYYVEITTGRGIRQVDADSFANIDGWLIFYRKPPTGGTVEYWRVKLDCVVSLETEKP